jgi:hypothetical protein
MKKEYDKSVLYLFIMLYSLFEIIGGNLKRNVVPLRIVKQMAQNLRDLQQSNRIAWEKILATYPNLKETDPSISESILAYTTTVTYLAEFPTTSSSIQRSFFTDPSKEVVESKGTLYLTDSRLIFVVLSPFFYH